MENAITQQLYIFFICVVSGVFLSLVYDCFRYIRSILRHKDIWVHMEDIIYTVYAFFHIFFVIQIYNKGQIRFYLFLGMIIGAFLYFSFFHRIIWFLFRILSAVFQMIHKGIRRVFHPFCEKIWKSFEKLLKNIYNTIRIIKSKK